MSFASLGLSDYLIRTLDELGYQKPTPIQHQAIPRVLQGRDVVAAAQTGSGKTAGFTLPILQKLSERPVTGYRDARSLVLVPTRELAIQVGEAVQTYARHLPFPLKVFAVFGGVKINPQMMALRGGADVLVATPGRLLDLVEQNAVKLADVESLVLDEADRMLDLGFADELNNILKRLPKKRQNLLFSATFPEEVKALTEKLLANPVHIAVESTYRVAERVQQRAVEVDRTNRTMLLRHLLKQEAWPRVLVFVASKRSANNVAMKLTKAGFKAAAFHGDLSQGARNSALADFKQEKLQVLVATDVAARGIDIAQLPCVVNYDLPRSTADYVHRIGRTGRAGEQGVALSFIGHEDNQHFALIEKRTKQKLNREQVAGFERSTTPPPELVEAPKGPIKGKRKSKKDKAREAAARATDPTLADSALQDSASAGRSLAEKSRETDMVEKAEKSEKGKKGENPWASWKRKSTK